MKRISVIICLCVSNLYGNTTIQRYQVPIPSGIKNFSLSVINDNSTTYTIPLPKANQQIDNQRVVRSIINDEQTQQSLMQSWRHYYKTHKMHIAGIAGAFFYSSLVCVALYYAYSAEHLSGWSQWRHEISLAQLYDLPRDQTAHNLFDAVKFKYQNQTKTLLDPLVYFMNDCEKELKVLRRFIDFREWLAFTKISYFMPAQEESIAIVYDKIARLEFFKDLLVSQLSEYHIETMV